MSTVPIEFNAKNPKILATITIDGPTSGSTVEELLGSDITITEYLIIKNNSREDLIITVNNSILAQKSIINLFGRSSIKIKTDSTRNISLSRSGSQAISVSIYGR